VLRSLSEITGNTASGRVIKGKVFGDPSIGRRLVVLLHGFGSSSENSANTAILHALGGERFVALTLDFMGHGESPGNAGETTITSGLEDVAAIYHAFRERYPMAPTAVCVLGSSFGGAVALASVELLRPVDVILRSPMIDIAGIQSKKRSSKEMDDWRRVGSIEIQGSKRRIRLNYDYYTDSARYDMEKILRSHPVPVFIVQGEFDEVSPIEFTKRFADRNRDLVELHIIQGADHRFSASNDFAGMIELLVNRLQSGCASE